PDATGIVSNTMLDRSKPFGATVSGFDAPIRADTLWEAARRQGKRVGVIFFPGADGTSPARTADWALNWPRDPLVKGKLHTLGAAAWQPAEVGEAKTFSPARAATLSFGSAPPAIRLIALDSTDDGTANYDHLLVASETGAVQDVRPGAWFPLEVQSTEGRT